MRLFECVQRRGSENSGRMLRLELAGRGLRRRAKRRVKDVVTEDMKSVAEERLRWRKMIGCGHP